MRIHFAYLECVVAQVIIHHQIVEFPADRAPVVPVRVEPQPLIVVLEISGQFVRIFARHACLSRLQRFVQFGANRLRRITKMTGKQLFQFKCTSDPRQRMQYLRRRCDRIGNRNPCSGQILSRELVAVGDFVGLVIDCDLFLHIEIEQAQAVARMVYRSRYMLP